MTRLELVRVDSALLPDLFVTYHPSSSPSIHKTSSSPAPQPGRGTSRIPLTRVSFFSFDGNERKNNHDVLCHFTYRSHFFTKSSQVVGWSADETCTGRERRMSFIQKWRKAKLQPGSVRSGQAINSDVAQFPSFSATSNEWSVISSSKTVELAAPLQFEVL